MNIKLLTEPTLKGDCTGSSESTLVKISHCLKSHVTAHMMIVSDSNMEVFAQEGSKSIYELNEKDRQNTFIT